MCPTISLCFSNFILVITLEFISCRNVFYEKHQWEITWFEKSAW